MGSGSAWQCGSTFVSPEFELVKAVSANTVNNHGFSYKGKDPTLSLFDSFSFSFSCTSHIYICISSNHSKCWGTHAERHGCRVQRSSSAADFGVAAASQQRILLAFTAITGDSPPPQPQPIFIFPPIFHFFSTTDRFFFNPTHIFPRPLLNPKP